MDSTSVLPSKISSPTLIYGDVNHLDQKYDAQGRLFNLSDFYSMRLDLETLKSINAEVQDLERALNAFGHYDLGSQIDLGTFKLQALPHVQYFVPAIAFGLTSKWTLGFGLPVVHYQNQFQISQEGSNIEQIKNKFAGLNPDIDFAFQRLEKNVIPEFYKYLIENGYKPLQNIDQTFLGDVQLLSLYQIENNNNFGLLLKTTINLPTGPKDNADDVTDMTIFGKSSIENSLLFQIPLFERHSLALKTTYKYELPEVKSVRIPLTSHDFLPPENQKADTRYKMGDFWSLGSAWISKWTQQIQTSIGIEYLQKKKDYYSYNGPVQGDLSILENNTQTEQVKDKFSLNYSTVETFLNRESLFPSQLSLEISDIIRGKNTMRQTTTELTATLFF